MRRLLLFTFLTGLLVSWKTQSIDLEKRTIFQNRIEILIPKEFKIMSEEMMKLKYPMERRPTLIFTDADGTVNVAFNHTTSRATPDLLEPYQESFVSTFKNLYPTAEWKSKGLKVISGKKFGFLELITPAIDTKVYNLIFFTDFEGKLLLCTFNCTVEKQDDWLAAAQRIMNSVIFK